MGLFIGGSILTLLEVFDYFFDVIKVSYIAECELLQQYLKCAKDCWSVFQAKAKSRKTNSSQFKDEKTTKSFVHQHKFDLERGAGGE